uniref:Vitellogenin domain-containing protein n=1 Tax=Homalodisca liturata TaxID=320908 RepID=A0A1B6I431_9HEMI
MEALEFLRLFLVFVLFSVSSVSPSHLRDKNICGKPVCKLPQAFKYLPDLRYYYQYNAKVDTVFDVEKNNSSTLIINAVVELQFSTFCHGYLKVSEVQITENNSTNDMESANYLDSFSEHILRFFFEDGLFQEVCPEPDEPVWVLNFKKGILSAFQNSMERLDLDHHAIETDINGECLTDYRLEAVDGTTLIISKQTQLASCVSRHQLHSIIPTSSYVFQTKYHKWSPMISSLACKQFVDHNIVSTVECSEHHSFLPFYNQTIGASTSVTLNISLIEEEDLYERDDAYKSMKIDKRTSLLYDTRKFIRENYSSIEETVALVISMCNLNSEELQPEFSEVFNKFIHIARYLPYHSVSELYKKSQSLCASGKKHVMDSLPHLRSSASIEVMKDIIMSEDLPETTISQFLIAMSLYNRPEAETIKAVTPLVLNRPPDIKTYLAVSSLIHSYCKLWSDCEADENVQSIVGHLEHWIQKHLFPEDQLEMTIGALKALGNAGVKTSTLVTSLQKVIVKRDLPVELRIAAISAHRHLTCGINSDFLLNIYQNNTNEDEIRIKAYLEVIKCPTLQTIKSIKDCLSKEESNQVGSFVWSHLHNMKVSAMPSRMEIQGMLQNSEFSAKFNKPYFKFSRNYESSFYINEYGIGGFIVSNVIFSHKSYIPRSLSFNVTVILFGEAINFAEITLDLEGFEQYAETLFWNNGILSNFEKSMGVLRFLRSSSSTMRSKIDSLPNVIADSFSVPKASLSIRVFGNEMKYSRITGKENINNLLYNLNPVKIIKDFLSGQEIKIEKSMLVCDARYVTPLAIGFPLNTDAIITSTIKLDMAGFINATAFTNEGQFSLDGKLKPSIAVNMVGSMAVDTYFKQTEVKVVSKIYTSTALAGNFKLKGYTYAWISLNLPLKKSEIFSGNNQLVVVRGGREVPLQGLTAGRMETKICSWPTLDDALGLTFCVNSLLPNSSLVLDSPMVIFNGPLNVEITLDKSDPSTQVYTLEYKMSELEDKRVLSVVFDTPNSTVKRGLKALLNWDKDGPNVTLEFQTTRTRLRAQGFYRNTEEEISLSFWLDMNGNKHIDLEVALYVKPSKYGVTYEPHLQFFITNKRIADLSGTLKWVMKNALSQCEIKLDFRTNRFNTSITGYVRTNNASVSTNLKLDYKFVNSTAEYVRLEAMLGDRSSRQISKLYGRVQLHSSTYSQINTLLHLNIQKGYRHLDCKMVLKTNPLVRDDSHKLIIRSELYYKTHNGSRADLEIEIKKADDDIDLKFSVMTHQTSGAISLTSIIRYSTDKEISITFDLAMPKGDLFLIESNFKVKIPNTVDAMMIHAHAHEKDQNVYDLDVLAVWFSGHNVTVRGSYEDKSTLLDSIHTMKLVGKSQLFQDISFTGRLHVGNKDYKTDIKVFYNNVAYGFKIHHQSQNPYLMVSNGEVSFGPSSYSVVNFIDMVTRQASMELHLDKYRDIHIRVVGPQNPTEIKAMVDFKWDANRDPTQKFLFTIEGSKKKQLNYEINSVIEYPGRTIVGTISLLHKDSDYTGLMKLEWSPSSAISVSSYLIWDPHKSGTVTFTSTVLTPFDNWKATHLNYGLWLFENTVRSNASLSWGHNGTAMADMVYKTLTSDSQVGFSVTALLNSTIREVSPLKFEISYSQSLQHIGALIDIESSFVHRVRIESSGRIEREPSYSNYSGLIKFKTPFHNLTNGELSAGFKMDFNNSFSGNFIIALNNRNITSSFEGSAKSLNESKLLLTLNTPFQKYQKIAGKFALSISKGHLIAELKSSTFALGLKTIYIFKNMRDFDLQLSAVTGVNFVSSFLLVGTLNNETVDFRGGWNSVLVGLTARSHYNGWYDLEYRGSLFMPFEGFRESGAVAKFTYSDKFHLEIAAAVAKVKVGLKVVSVFRPEEEFALSENIYCDGLDVDESGGSKGKGSPKNTPPLWRALFELDTLYYPTATGHIKVVNYEQHSYSTTARLQLNIIDVCLEDLFTFENILAMGNELMITSTNPIVSEIKSNFELDGNSASDNVVKLNLDILSSNNTFKFDMSGEYHFQPVGDVENEGIYSVNYRLSTPFKALDHCFFDFNVQAEKYFFSSNMTVDVVNNTIKMDGTLEVDENFFGLATEFSVATSSFNLPFCQLSFTKDFSAVEKSVTIVLKYPNEESVSQHFEVGTSWHFGGEQYLKLSGNIITPFKELEDLQTSFLFSSEPEDREYNLEISFKNSPSIELEISGKIQMEKIYLHIESSLDQFRELMMNGTLKQQDGKLILESQVSLDQTACMDLQISSSQGVPLFMIARLTDNRRWQQGDVKDLVTVTVDLRRKRVHGAVGYDLITLVQSGTLSINFDSEITSRPSEENWSFSVTSNDERYKEISLKVTVIPGKDQIFEISINGHTDTVPFKSEFDVVCNMWFDGKKGRVKANLDSWPLSGDSYLEWDYLSDVMGLVNTSYIFYNTTRDISSYIFFRSSTQSLEDICMGVDISLNKKNWWFSTNVTVMAPAVNDISFTSFLLLPHNVQEVHSLVGKLYYTPDYKHINQVLKYSSALSKMGLQTSLQIRMSNRALEGTVFLKGGVNGAYFLRDNFTATIKNNQCDVNSVFISSFTREDITIDMHYKKPQLIHKITMVVNSPGHTVKILASVDFETINNMYTNINCTTPLSTFPHLGLLLQAVSNQDLFFRYGELMWPNNSAMFNYTHNRTPLENTDVSKNDGILLVDFPLATRHTITLTYTYEENSKFSSGLTGLVYNDDVILQGNFSRHKEISEVLTNDNIKIHLTNMYMPLGLNYHHTLNRDAANPIHIYTDKKLIEIFKAEDSTFNITGELIIGKTNLDDFMDLNLIHLNRSLKLRTVFGYNNTIHYIAHVALKPSVWAASKFYLYRKHRAMVSNEEVLFELSYPRRDLSMSAAYEWTPQGLSCRGSLAPGSHSQPVAASLNWQALDNFNHQAVLLLSHPYLEKNITLSASLRQNEHEILSVDTEIDYAILPSRKLSLCGSLIRRSNTSEKDYELSISAKHPISRFHMEIIGALERKPGYFFAFKNFSYARNFLQLQFWNSSLKIDLNNKQFEAQRQSLRDLTHIRTKYSKQGTKYNLEGNLIRDKNINISGHGFVDFHNIKTSATVNLTPDATEQLLVSGDYLDKRHAFFKIWRMYNDLSINDISFLLRLNHSRLLTTSYFWRTTIKQDFVDGFHASSSFLWTYVSDTVEFWTDFMKNEILDTMNDIWFDAELDLQNFIDDITNLEMLKSDIEYFHGVFNESYEANEFYMQDIYNITLLLAEEIAFRDKMGDLPKIVSELWQVMGETGESVRQSILYVIESVKKMYMKAVAVCSELIEGNALQHLSQLIGRLSSKYDKMIKDLHVTFVNYVELLWNQMAITLTESWNRMLQVIEPAFIEFVHYVDSLFWDFSKTIVEFLYQKQSLILTSANLAKDSNFTKDLDKFYKDVTKNGFVISFKKYAVMVYAMVKEKYLKVVPFGYELTEITSEIYDEIKELYKLPAINFTIEATTTIYEKTLWLYSYFNLGEKIQQAFPLVYGKFVDLSHTALQNEIINHERKTNFVFEPRRGELYLEQQLPMPWHSFNRIPNFEEIKEYKMITDVQKWLTPSNHTFWSLYYQYSPLTDYHNWLPPYAGEAIIGKNYYFVTFDKQHYSFRSPCSYLLAKDFVRDDFALVLSYTNGKHVIDLFVGPYIIEIDLDSDTVRIPSHGMQIPVNLNGTLVFFEFGIITIVNDMGFNIQCNVKYDICTIRLSGWYFGKTAGLLGTMDHEPNNDFFMSNGEIAQDQMRFTHSWLLDSSQGKCASYLPAQRKPINPNFMATCDDFFRAKLSQFSSCFPIVDPSPYYTLCHNSLSDIDSNICTSAIMYVQECLANNIPLRTPNICVRCPLQGNGYMQEGDFTQLKENIPQSSDIVFIIEANKCNDFKTHKSIMPTIAGAIYKELTDLNMFNNRFAVVVYGGDDVFDEPHNLIYNDEVFISYKHVAQLLTHIPIGNGNPDTFKAIRFASKLNFRPGVSKTFILIPCSSCDNNGTFDYSALHQVLIERDIKVHILMNVDFGLEKVRSNRILYGVDSKTAYTKNDFKVLKGDRDLRRQVKLSKHLPGYCALLALESNGTVFSTKKLENVNQNAAKKFITVFAKRLASSARPSDCQNCECTADENGVDTIDCVLCHYPTPVFDDFELKDNSSFFRSIEDSDDFDYNGNDNL